MIKYPDLGGGARKVSILSTEHASQKYRPFIGPNASEEEFREKSRLPVATFFDLLWRFANKRSTGPRDKIYTYMGMAINQEEIRRTPIDYEISVPSYIDRLSVRISKCTRI